MLKFIKAYWLYLLLIILGVTYAITKAVNSELSDAIFALAFIVVAITLLFNRVDYDELEEDYSQLIVDHIRELNSNIDFINRSKQTLKDIMNDVSEISNSTDLLDYDEITDPFSGQTTTIVVSATKKAKAKKKSTTKKKA